MADMSAEASAKTLWMGRAQHLKGLMHAKTGAFEAKEARIAFFIEDIETSVP